MLFNTLEFFVFFSVVYGLYRLLDTRRQNLMLLLASYVFYGSWDWRFLGLLWISTLVDFALGRAIHRSDSPRRRKLLVTASLVVNLGILGVFKYFDFFSVNLQALLSTLGVQASLPLLHVILPVGISFYTFQTLSYTIDIYRRKFDPVDSLLDFALFVGFFPQLVAGPIERASSLLPQIAKARTILPEEVRKGLWLILWGLFKKIFVADNLARLVDPVFANYADCSGLEVLLATYGFTFQILADFSGYTDIARGVAKLMGFELMVNFRFPYFVTNPRDFWREWHISLSTWLRDYLYIPLGGNRGSRWFIYRNLMVTFLLGGFWHGASWNYIAWGAYEGLLLVLNHLIGPFLAHKVRGRALDRTIVAAKIIAFFHVTIVGMFIVRCQSVDQFTTMAGRLWTSFLANPGFERYLGWKLGFLVLPLLAMELTQKLSGDRYIHLRWPLAARWTVYLAVVYLTLFFGEFGYNPFIYFQF